jgi:hypothetical protein
VIFNYCDRSEIEFSPVVSRLCFRQKKNLARFVRPKVVSSCLFFPSVGVLVVIVTSYWLLIPQSFKKEEEEEEEKVVVVLAVVLAGGFFVCSHLKPFNSFGCGRIVSTANRISYKN